MTISDEATVVALQAWRATPFGGDALMAALEAAAPYIRAGALEEAADVAHDNTIGMDGSEIRAAENRGFMQRHNVSSAAKWLRARAAEMRQRDAES